MFDYFRVACAVPDVEVADVDFNVSQMLGYIEKAKNEKVDLLLFPELGITGYTCADLFFQKALLSAALCGIKRIVDRSNGINTVIAAGAPIEVDGCLYNCAVIIANGKICGIVPKTFIPNHSEFQEKRWFGSAVDLDKTAVSSSVFGIENEYDIPVGNLVFDASGVKIGFEICEDLWAPLPPSTMLCLSGAEIIANLSASNETVGSRNARTQHVSQQAAKNFCGYAFCSAGRLESTSDLVFSGHSIISECGTAVAEQQSRISSDYMIIGDIDLSKIRHDRVNNTTFSDSKSFCTMPDIITVELPVCASEACGKYAEVKKLPFIPSTEKERLERCSSIFEIQVAGLKKRLSKTGCKPVIGISGGLDSTLALLVSVQAIKELGRPLSDVIGITMPCFGTTDRTYNNAINLMKSLGITYKEINIKKACLQHFEDIGQSADNYDLTYENAQARERTQVLMDYAGRVGGIVIGTGDMSEMALGWCTYNGDHMSMYGVNSSVPKTLIRWIIDTLIKNGTFTESAEYLTDIVNTPISPELLPPDTKGEIAQQTESIVGPYALHDFFLYNIIRYGFEPDKIYALAKKAFAEDFDGETIMNWLKTFYRRFFTQQFKRSCAPDGIKIGSVGLSAKGDWRIPSDASASLWLKGLDKIEF